MGSDEVAYRNRTQGGEIYRDPSNGLTVMVTAALPAGYAIKVDDAGRTEPWLIPVLHHMS